MLTSILATGCEITPQEMYLYKDAEFVQIKGSSSLVAKDSIAKEEGLASFIIDDTQFKSMTIDCNKSLGKVNYIFKNGTWDKVLNSQWVKVKDNAIKNYVCQ